MLNYVLYVLHVLCLNAEVDKMRMEYACVRCYALHAEVIYIN